MGPTVHIRIDMPLRVVSYPSPDQKGVVMAHALDFDVLGHGATHDAAVEMLKQALSEQMSFRLSRGLAMLVWRSAPEEVWKIAEKAFGHALDREPPTDQAVQEEFVACDDDAPKRKKRTTGPLPVLIQSDQPPSFAHAG